MDKRILKNAILYECAEYFGVNEKIKTDSVKLLDSVLDFYAKFYEQFKYEVKSPSLDGAELVRTEYGGVTFKKLHDIHKWLKDNEILYLEKDFFDVENGETGLMFIFASKEDAAAFKLKWY